MLAFSADGRTLMTASYADQSAKTWDLPSGKLLATFPTRKWDESRDREPGALSPDGRIAVVLVSDNAADLFDARTGKKIVRLNHSGKIFCTSFSPDGRYLVTAAENESRLWTCGTWDKPKNKFGGARLAVFSPDSRFLATAWNPTFSTNLRILDVPQLTVKATLEFWFPVLEVAYSRDGRTMAAVCDGQDGTNIGLYDVETNAWQRNVGWNQANLHNVAFSADSKLLAVSTREGSLHLWDLDICQPRAAYRGGTNRFSRFQFAPDGRTLATSTDQGAVTLCDMSLFAGPEPVNGRSLACPGRLAIDPKAKRVAVGARDHRVSLWSAESGQLDCHLTGNWQAVQDIAFSPDGGCVVTVDLRHIRCWNTTNGRQLWQCESPGVHSVAWSPLGPVLATGGLDHHVRLFDATTGKQTALLQGHTGQVFWVRFFPDGKRLASGGYDLTARIWDIASRRAIKTILHKAPVLSLAIPPDGRELAVGLPLGKLVLWRPSESKSSEPREILWTSSYKPWFAGQEPGISYSPDGSLLGTAGPGGIFRAQNRATGELAFALSGAGVDPMTAAWLPNRSPLVTVSSSNDVMLWDTTTWHGHRAFGGPLAAVRSLAYCGNGKMLAVATDRAAGLESFRSDAQRSGPSIRIPDQLLRSNGAGPAPSIKRQAVTARDYIPWQSTNDTLRFWESASSAEQSLLPSLPTLSAVSAVACSPTQNVLAAASRDGSLWIWDMGTHELRAHLFLDEAVRKKIDAANSRSPALVPQETLRTDAAPPLLAFSPEGSRLAACDQAGTVRFWETRDWREMASLPNQHIRPKTLVYSRDGSILAVNDQEQVKLYDPRSRASLGTTGTAAHADICCGQFSPYGALLALGTRDGSICFVDTHSHRTDTTLVGHGDAVVSLDFAPDGRTLATGSWDATVRLWDIASKREVAVLEGHRGRVHAVAFSPDGTVLASGGEIDNSPEQGLGELFLWRTAGKKMASEDPSRVE